MAEENRHTRLQKLTGSGLEQSVSVPDIHRWPVRNSVNQLVGKVQEMIVDLADTRIRYLAIDLAGNDLDLPARSVLIPVGIAEIHATDDDVILPGITRQQLLDLPDYDEGRFDNSHENDIRNVLGGLGASAMAGGSDNDADIYAHEHFNEGNLGRNRNSGK